LFQQIGSGHYDIIFGDSDDGQIGLDAAAVIFAPVSVAMLPKVNGAENAPVVRLYPGETQPEVQANLFIIGDALGERVAALNAAAQLVNPAPQPEVTPEAAAA
jgi:hypothetical protein